MCLEFDISNDFQITWTVIQNDNDNLYYDRQCRLDNSIFGRNSVKIDLSCVKHGVKRISYFKRQNMSKLRCHDIGVCVYVWIKQKIRKLFLILLASQSACYTNCCVELCFLPYCAHSTVCDFDWMLKNIVTSN